MIQSRLIVFSVLLLLFSVGLTACQEKVSAPVTGSSLDSFTPDRVSEVRIVMKEDIWKNLQSRAIKEEYKKADFWYDGELVQDVAIRAKGSSSLTYVVEDGSIRFSFKIDFNLLNSLRNFRGLKKVNFNSGYRDPTLMREKLAYELFEYMEVPVPRTAFVDLWINNTHMGLYTQVEQVDTTFLNWQFPGSDGNLYKPIPPGSFLDWTEEDLEKQREEMTRTASPDTDGVNIGGGNFNEIQDVLSEKESEGEEIVRGEGDKFDYIDYMKLKTNEKRANHSALMRFIDVLNNEPDETFPEEIERVLDVDEALRFLAVQTVLVNLDSYLGRGLNYYLYEVNGKFVLIPWDLNESFGTYKCDIPKDRIIDFYIHEPTCGPVEERPLVDRLLSHEPYLHTYRTYLEELINGPFSVDEMGARIDEITELILPYVEADELKFYSTEEFQTNLTQDVGRYFGLKSFVAKRGESIRLQLDGKLPSDGGGAGNGGDPDKA